MTSTAQSGCQMPAHPCPQGAKGSEGSSTQEGTCTSSQSHDSPDLLGPAEWETWNSRQGCKPRFPVPSLSVTCHLNTVSCHHAFRERVSLPAVPVFPDVRTQSFRSLTGCCPREGPSPQASRHLTQPRCPPSQGLRR